MTLVQFLQVLGVVVFLATITALSALLPEIIVFVRAKYGED